MKKCANHYAVAVDLGASGGKKMCIRDSLRAESLNYIGQSLPGERAHRSIVLHVVIDGIFELLALDGVKEKPGLLAGLSLGNRIAVVVSAYWDPGGFGSQYKLLTRLFKGLLSL